MKKSITVIVFLFVALAIASCAGHKNPASIEAPVEDRLYYQKGYDYLNNRISHEYYYYDGAGRLVSYTAVNTVLEGDKLFKYYYDSFGVMDKIEYFNDGLLLVQSDLVYDSYGRVTYSVQTDNSGVVFAVNYYSYNAAGLMTQRIEEWADPSLSIKVIYGYNSTDHLVQQDFYLMDGTYLGKFVNTYNSDQILIARDQYGEIGNHLVHWATSIGFNNKREKMWRYEPVSYLKAEVQNYYEVGQAELTETETEFINTTYISVGGY